VVLAASAATARKKLDWNPTRAVLADAWQFAQNIAREG
jgi:UDP-glucose 4-epimerase